ncbi:MAG: cytidine/deoxycytidylate deaminase family protein [Candidatus Magasanikbacteria bacterium]|nr:cytidine/deoxycytidylate deaminase family protein [Candidatus Magasanikbacteria bacterium]
MPEEKYVRPSWDEYFMEIARTVASRSTCDRGRGGCVVVKDKQILVTGYVGSPPGLPHCDDVGHQMKTVTHEDGKTSQHCMRTIHMEQNAICQAARRGISIDGATIYEKYTSCPACAKLLIAAGIKRAVYAKRYHVYEETEAMFKATGIELKYFDDSIEPYANQ